MENFILIFLCLLLGYIIARFHIFSLDAPKTLNQFVIFVSLPAMILLQVPKLHLSSELFIPVVIAWVVMTMTAIFTFYASRFLSFSREVTGALMLVSVLTNSSFLGIPIINAYMGESALPYVMIYDQFGTFLAFALYGTFIVAYYSHTSEVNLKIILMKIVSFPPFIALVLALMLMGVRFEEHIVKVLFTLSNTIVPVALVAVGLQLQLRLTKDELKPFSVSLIIKLLIAPLVAILLAKLFGWDNEASHVAILEAGMAPMITAGAMASMAGLAPKLTSAIVGYGILFSFATSFICYYFIS